MKSKIMTELNETKCCNTNSNTKILQTLGLRVFIDPSKCIACSLCEEICPFGLPKKEENGKYYITNPKRCTECSACQRNCPTNAILMEEQLGCGCLWDARKRTKEKSQNNCCC
jgi:NAD-dependent dihydropyrimidine dehydrogenase PreA subunit